MNKKFGIFFWVSIFMPVVLIALYSAGVIPLWKETAIGMLLGVMMIMYAGIWMEKHLPGLSAKIALLAPACFLTFMLHWPIYGFLPPAMKSSLFAFFTPLLVFAAIVLFYFALKTFCPVPSAVSGPCEKYRPAASAAWRVRRNDSFNQGPFRDESIIRKGRREPHARNTGELLKNHGQTGSRKP